MKAGDGMTLKAALDLTGFIKCEFGPDNDPCERCGLTNKQHYFHSPGCEYPDEGVYYCAKCVTEHAKDLDKPL